MTPYVMNRCTRLYYLFLLIPYSYLSELAGLVLAALSD